METELPAARPATTSATHHGGDPFTLADVWSRSGKTYRSRAIVLLAVNVLLFAGTASFTYWLRSGEFFAPVREGYWDSIVQTFSGVGRPDVSLAAFLIDPISIHDVPVQIPIVGLLMAALIAVPILVAILYRFWSSLPFILIIGLVAVMPWLAITLLGSCVIASVRPFRTRIRFMSAMLALIPAIVYLVLAYSGTRDVVVGRIDPVDRVKFVAPWVLAIVASAVVFAVVLTVARIVNYRPGAVTPLLVLMFAIPVLLFERFVGRDELYYRLLEQQSRDWFADANGGLGLSSAQNQWLSPAPSKPAKERLKALEEESWLFELALDLSRRQRLLEEKKSATISRCDRFLHDFPYSQYAPNALFIKARTGDLRLDVEEFHKTRWIRLYDDVPDSKSKQTWEVIVRNRPESSMAAVALLRLAQIDSRECEMDRAKSRLGTLLNEFDRPATEPLRIPSEGATLFLERPGPDTGLEIFMEGVILQASRLYGLLSENADDPSVRSDPLCGAQQGRNGPDFGLLDLDPRAEDYPKSLRVLLDAYPESKLADNIELELARALPETSAQIEAFRKLVERYPAGDAVPEALIRLGLALKSAGEVDSSGLVFRRLAGEYPDSIWARQSSELRLLPTPLTMSWNP